MALLFRDLNPLARSPAHSPDSRSNRARSGAPPAPASASSVTSLLHRIQNAAVLHAAAPPAAPASPAARTTARTPSADWSPSALAASGSATTMVFLIRAAVPGVARPDEAPLFPAVSTASSSDANGVSWLIWFAITTRSTTSPPQHVFGFGPLRGINRRQKRRRRWPNARRRSDVSNPVTITTERPAAARAA